MAVLNKASWQQRLREFFRKPRFSEESLEELEDLLLEADIAPTLTMGFCDELRTQAVKQKLESEEDLLKQLGQQLETSLLAGYTEFEERICQTDKLQVIMMLGVNGVGKTTSLAKLAAYLSQNPKPNFAIDTTKITIGAGDTFRAAAIEQLKIHGERLNVRVVAQKQGSDSAAVIYDAVSSALARNDKIVMLDTAGRMHTKKLLLEELGKIDRVLDRLIEPEQRHNLLVLDATTGKNALQQAEAFDELLKLRGVIVTKMDAKCGGGIVFSLSEKLQLPVLYEGRGEAHTQLAPFVPTLYVERLLGLSNANEKKLGL